MIRGLYKTLVLKYASDHIILEEEHSMNYKSHMLLVNVMYRSAWFLFGYILIWNAFLLGDPGKVI
jgi:hypothetical protein